MSYKYKLFIMKVVRPLDIESGKKKEIKNKIDISQFEDVENDEDYSVPCVLAYDETEDSLEDNHKK